MELRIESRLSAPPPKLILIAHSFIYSAVRSFSYKKPAAPQSKNIGDVRTRYVHPRKVMLLLLLLLLSSDL